MQRHTDTQTHRHTCVFVCVLVRVYTYMHTGAHVQTLGIGRFMIETSLLSRCNTIYTTRRATQRHSNPHSHTHIQSYPHPHRAREHAPDTPEHPHVNTQSRICTYNYHDIYSSNHHYRVVGQKCGKHECCQNAK